MTFLLVFLADDYIWLAYTYSYSSSHPINKNTNEENDFSSFGWVLDGTRRAPIDASDKRIGKLHIQHKRDGEWGIYDDDEDFICIYDASDSNTIDNIQWVQG